MEIKFTKDFKNDFSRLHQYFLQYNSEAVASKRIERIKNEIVRLETAPQIGSLLKSVMDTKRDIRFLVCGRYLVFYKITKENIVVLNVCDGRQNWQNIIF